MRDAAWVAERPTGTVTFLFTDVVGSTRLWEEYPFEMRDALERHDRALRLVIEAHGGYVFSTGGDAFAVAFGRAADGVEVAVAAQRVLAAESWPEATPLRVRMGLHTGEAQERDGDYFGTALNRAARIMGLGSGEQVLMSAATAELVDVDRRSEGVCELRGLTGRTEVFTVLADGLRSDFAPLRVAAVPSNLPTVDAQLVGRASDLDALSERLESVRLLTLVGPGGIGKTSLAVGLARRVEDRFPAGVWWVELAPVRDPDAIVAVLGSAVGARAEGGGSLLDAVLAVLGSGPALVLLDNCEHLSEASSELARVLTMESSTTVVATSRIPLHLRDEHVWSVSPLGFGGDHSDAMRLFVERARQVRHDFAVDEASSEAVGRICALVDGMPLAVELAAARCRSMSPADVLDRLERDAGRVLRDARRDGQERQRTLTATIEWSYQLLSAEERELFARLSVFAGSFDLEATEAVCAGGAVDEFDVVDLLDALVDQSMVVMADRAASNTARYRLLEPIRQFAEARVDDPGALAERHARHYAGLAEVGYEGIWTEAEAEWVERLEADFDNHRVAYQFWAERGELTEALTIAITLNQLGELVLQRPAGAEVLRSALALDGVEDHELGPIAMAHVAAGMARRLDTQAIPLAERAVELAATPMARMEASLWAVGAAMMLGDVEQGTAGWRRGVAFARAVDLPRAQMGADGLEVLFAVLDGNLAAATDMLASMPTQSASALQQSILDIGRIPLAEATGDYRHALDLAQDTVLRARTNGNRWAVGNSVLTAAFAATKVLEPPELLKLFADSIPEWRQANDLGRLGGSFAYVAYGLAGLGDNELAAKLLGSETSHSIIRTSPRDQELRDQLGTDIRHRIGDDEYERLQREGSATSIRTLADQALKRIDHHLST